MLFIYTFITASLLTTGQALWKNSSSVFTLSGNKGFPDFSTLIKLVCSWQFLLGVLFYMSATFLYIWLFSKYPYYVVQLTLASFAIVLTLFVSALLFKEHITVLNYLGAFIIIVGMVLVSWKAP